MFDTVCEQISLASEVRIFLSSCPVDGDHYNKCSATRKLHSLRAIISQMFHLCEELHESIYNFAVFYLLLIL